MIYCPRCHSITSEMICPVCFTDVYNYSEQQNKLNQVDIDTLRSDHRIMSNIEQNQKDMLAILSDGELAFEEYDVYVIDSEGVYFCVRSE